MERKINLTSEERKVLAKAIEITEKYRTVAKKEPYNFGGFRKVDHNTFTEVVSVLLEMKLEP